MARFTVLLLLALGAVLLPSQPSMAASCSGSSCAGLNPHSTGCDVGAVNKKEISTGAGTVDIRYSPTCHAFWARGLTSSPDPFCDIYVNIIQITSGSITRKQRLVTPHYGPCDGSFHWTYMIADLAANDRYNACLTWGPFNVPQDPGEDDYCTGRF
jgi:hypothetical protein